MDTQNSMSAAVPAVSVIMLTYNHEKYIAQAIESVLMQQTDFAYELLIGDDASTDGTADIVREYEQRYPDIIRVYRREQQVGSTRNGYELLLVARGEYIAACEGDDYWSDPDKLRIQKEFLDTHPDHSGVAHEMEIVDEDGTPTKNQKLRWVSKNRHYTVKDFKGIFIPAHPNSLMRRNFFLEDDYDGSIFYKASPMIGDRTNALIWAARGEIYRMPQVMGCYRMVRRNGATNITSVMYLGDRIAAIEEDFRYTSALEKFNNEQLRSAADFEYHKYELYASCVFLSVRSGKSSELSVLKHKILSACKSRFKCRVSFIYILLLRCKDALFRTRG